MADRACPVCGSAAVGAFCGACGSAVPESPSDGTLDQTQTRPTAVGKAPYTPPGFLPPGVAPAQPWQTGTTVPSPVPPPAPAPSPSRRPWGWVVAGVVGAAVVVVAGAWVLKVMVIDPRLADTVAVPTASPASASSPKNSSAAPAPVPTVTRTVTVTSEESVPASTSPAVDAGAQLAQQRQADLARLSLDGSWAVQLASKFDGVTDNSLVAANGSHTFYLADILAEHRVLRSRFSGVPVLLVTASDFGKQRAWGKTIWVTLATPGFSSQEAATAWCASRYPSLSEKDRTNVCLPRQLLPPHS